MAILLSVDQNKSASSTYNFSSQIILFIKNSFIKTSICQVVATGVLVRLYVNFTIASNFSQIVQFQLSLSIFISKRASLHQSSVHMILKKRKKPSTSRVLNVFGVFAAEVSQFLLSNSIQAKAKMNIKAMKANAKQSEKIQSALSCFWQSGTRSLVNSGRK